MAELKLVIFDCDGVLMDSEVISAEAELSVYRKYGLEISAQEFSERFAGSASIEIMKEIERDLDLPLSASMLDEIVNAVDLMCGKHAPMIEGADPMLDVLKCKYCVCSNSPHNRLKQMLGRVGLFDRFAPHIYSSKDFDPPANKPKPDVFLKALNKFGVSASDAVGVEDSVHGVEAGVAAGIRVIGFTGASHTFTGHSDALMAAGAQTVIRRLVDLPPLLNALEQWGGLAD